MLCPVQNLKNLSDIEKPDFALFFINKIEAIITREIRMKSKSLFSKIESRGEINASSIVFNIIIHYYGKVNYQIYNI